MKRWWIFWSGSLESKYRYALFAVWAVIVIGYVQTKAPIIWQADWTHDDLMNSYRAFQASWKQIGLDILCFWRPSALYRPLGELFYKVLFEQFGMSAFGWRAVVSVFLIGNAFVLGHVASRLSGSMAVGLAATAIASFHSLWSHLYLNTGTIFEILAFTFVWGGLAFYVEFHEKAWVPYATSLIFILGLNAKESAIVLPVYVVLYEWIWKKRTPWVFCGLAIAISIAFIAGRVYGPGGLSSIGSYRPEYSLGMYARSFQQYFGPLILWQTIPLWASVAIASLPFLLRTRLATFAALVFPVGILPLAFVPNRGLDGVYVACAALALAVSSVLLLMPRENWRYAGAAVLFVIFGLWMPGLRSVNGWDKEFREIRGFHEGLKSLAPVLPPKVQIRFVKEPFGPETPWASVFATRLVYRDMTIEVAGEHNPHTKNLPASNDFAVFEWRDGKLVRLK